jgi:hypothetical protein
MMTMMYNTQNYWIFGLRPSSRVPKTRKRNILETGFFCLQGRGGRYLLCWVRKKGLTSITGQPMFKFKFKLYYDRRSVGQFVLVSGPKTNWVSNLQCNHALVRVAQDP